MQNPVPIGGGKNIFWGEGEVGSKVLSSKREGIKKIDIN